MKNPDGILFSVPRETERKVQKILEISQKRMPRETDSTRVKNQLGRMHISIWTRFMVSSMQAALRMDPCYEKKMELFKISELENIKGLFGISRLIIEGNPEVKNVFSRRRCEFTLGKTCITQRTSIKMDESKSVRLLGPHVMLGKRARPEDATRRWNDEVSTLKMYPNLRESQGLGGDPIDFEWKIFPGATKLDILHTIQAHLQGKNVTPEKISD